MTDKEFAEGIAVGLEVEADEAIAKMKGISYEEWIAIKEGK